MNLNDRIVIVCTSAPQMVAGALNQYCTLSQPCTCWVWAEDNGCCVAGCQCDILSSKTITVSQTRICDTMSSLLWRAVLVSVLGACACVTCFGNGHHSTSFKNGHQRIQNSPSRLGYRSKKYKYFRILCNNSNNFACLAWVDCTIQKLCLIASSCLQCKLPVWYFSSR